MLLLQKQIMIKNRVIAHPYSESNKYANFDIDWHNRMADVLIFSSFSLYFCKSSRGLWNDNALGAHRGSGMLCCCSGMCWRTAEVQNADPLFPSSSGFQSFPLSVSDCLPVCRVLVLIAVCHAIRHSVMPWLSMVLALLLFLCLSLCFCPSA